MYYKCQITKLLKDSEAFENDLLLQFSTFFDELLLYIFCETHKKSYETKIAVAESNL